MQSGFGHGACYRGPDVILGHYATEGVPEVDE